MSFECSKRLPNIALKWAPHGKRNRGRLLGTWRREIKEEVKATDKTWHELKWLAQDREERRKLVAPYIPHGVTWIK